MTNTAYKTRKLLSMLSSAEKENNTIAAAIEKVHGMTTKTEDDA